VRLTVYVCMTVCNVYMYVFVYVYLGLVMSAYVYMNVSGYVDMCIYL